MKTILRKLKHRRRIGIIAVRDKCDPDLYLDGISFQRIAYGNQSCKGRLQKDGNTLFHLLMQVDDTAYMFERFICVFGIQPDTTLIDKIFKELILFTARAA